MPARKRRASFTYRRRTSSKRARISGRRMKTYRRKVFRRRPKMTRSLGLIAPNSLMSKFKYTGSWNVSYSTPGTTDKLNFYANNPYDPLPGVSTQKCTGFDELMALYEFGICYAVKISYRASFNLSTDYPLCLYCHVDSSRANYNKTLSIDEVTETRLVNRWTLLQPTTMTTNQVNTFRPHRVFQKIKYVEKKKELEPSDYRFTDGSGPTSLVQAHIGTVKTLPSQSGWTLNLFVQITYYCKLFEKKITGA